MASLGQFPEHVLESLASSDRELNTEALMLSPRRGHRPEDAILMTVLASPTWKGTVSTAVI